MFWSTRIPKSTVPMVNLDSEESLGLRRVESWPHAIRGASGRICGLAAFRFRVSVSNAFSKLLQAIPKSDLSTYVLCLMIYLMSYDLCLTLCLMTYVLCLIWCLMSYALMALVYVLLLGLRLAILWLVSMHCFLSTCHLLLILIPFEEPPHLTADSVEQTCRKLYDKLQKLRWDQQQPPSLNLWRRPKIRTIVSCLKTDTFQCVQWSTIADNKTDSV